MGDIARHRDVFLNTRDSIPTSLLGRCNLTVNDLTYLEIGNYLTDVSQFRDPVTYIFAKRRIWLEKVLPNVPKHKVVQALNALVAAAALVSAEELQRRGKHISGVLPLAALPLQGLASNRLNDIFAGLGGLDNWIDKMFGKPFERLSLTSNKRDDKDYGYVGEFFQFFIEGITHLLFANEVSRRMQGEWNRIERIPESSVTDVFRHSFSQYYPHEHTDQPPYIWDASLRPKDRRYQRSTRQQNLVDTDIGIMNVVDEEYVEYLSQELSKLEAEFQKFQANDSLARRKWLVRMGKVLHGIEDWYFHSNVVELIHLRDNKRKPQETDEDHLQRFVKEKSRDASFNAGPNADAVEIQRRLYRTLRFPIYFRGNKANSAGIISKKDSTPSINHAYPAFPSQQDTAHTLLGALENLQEKVHDARAHAGASSGNPTSFGPALLCILSKFVLEGKDVRDLISERCAARGVTEAAFYVSLAPRGTTSAAIQAARTDVLRELLPMVLTLMDESERQRLNANISPMEWPAKKVGPPGPRETNDQTNRHEKALKPKNIAGFPENNYQRAARYLNDCGYINVPGKDALVRAFAIDQTAEKLHSGAPGCGGFLIQFALELQAAVDAGEAQAKKLNKSTASIFDKASDNESFNEIIGSHSLMSKDTLGSSPFFDDAKVLASVASQCVFRLMLEEVSAPVPGEGRHWLKILHHLIRYPPSSGEWEREAMTKFRPGRVIPKFDDLTELAKLKSARLPTAILQTVRKGTKATELESEYIKLEKKVSKYRYPS